MIKTSQEFFLATCIMAGLGLHLAQAEIPLLVLASVCGTICFLGRITGD